MATTTQPILCCVGQHVAGKPTQFLMERAFAAEGIDWQAITVEVTEADFTAAMDGMWAMRFQAIRFFSSLQSASCKRLCPPDDRFHFLGKITSAMAADSGWNYWHNVGPAIQQWVSQFVDFSQSICWLNQDSDRCRSLLVSLDSSCLPLAVFWSADMAPQLPSWLAELQSNAGRPLVHTFEGDELEIVLKPATRVDSEAEAEAASEVEVKTETKAADEKGREADKEDSGNTQPTAPTPARPSAESADLAEIISAAKSVVWVGDKWPEKPFIALTQRSLEWMVVCDEEHLQLAGVDATRIQQLSDIDLAIACEAYDFFRWTDRQLEFGMLRDAYEEYSAF